MGNKLLVLAYGFLWLIFILYAWNISRRQARLRQRLEELSGKIQDRLPPDSSSSGGSETGVHREAGRRR